MSSPLLNVMINAVKKASIKLRRDFNELENLQISTKGPANFVTSADIRTQEIIFNELIKAEPDWSYTMEEKESIKSKLSSNRFIIDPIDGTTNFLHGNPYFSISIAAEIEKKIQIALVYSPISDELFTAERGKGAFLNDKRIRIAGRKKLSESLIVIDIPHLDGRDHLVFIKQFQELMPLVAGIRRSGSAALDLAWLAAGRYDAFWERNLSEWDVAAGILLVKEAGGFVTGIDGTQEDLLKGNILAGNEKIHNLLFKKIKTF